MITNIFLLDGLGGTGKSDFMNHITKKYNSKPARGVIIKKFTTRLRRPEEKNKRIHLDLKFVTPSTFYCHQKQGDLYTYGFGGYSYGFHQEDIKEQVKARVKHIFLIVKDRMIQECLQKDFPRCNVIRVYIYSDRDEIQKRLKASGYKKEDITFRLSRIKDNWFDYIEQAAAYSEIIINNSNRKSFHKIIDILISKYENYPRDELCIDNYFRYPIMRPLIGYKDKMLHQLSTYDFDKNVFLMMKFRKNNKSIHTYIQKALKEKGYNCIRSDDNNWDITHNIYNPLAVLYCCKYGIALFDKAEPKNEFSPNVSYELGVMHYQRKNCLILKHKSLGSLPFDLIKDIYQEYRDTDDAISLIDKWLSRISF